MEQTTYYLIGIGVSAALTLNLAFFRWLDKKFKSVEDTAKEVRDTTRTVLDNHEDKDQHRHEENIERFAVVETKLNIIMKNGH